MQKQVQKSQAHLSRYIKTMAKPNIHSGKKKTCKKMAREGLYLILIKVTDVKPAANNHIKWGKK